MVRGRSFAGMFIGLLCACGESTPPPQPVATEVGAPEWVTRGSGAFTNKGERIFYGVGVASGMRNRALATTTAENRARAELTKTFEVYSASLMKDYMASTTAGDMSASSEEQHVEQAIKTFSAQTLSGVLIIDHWFDTEGSIYALAKLDLATMQANLANAKALNAQVRAYVRKNADKSFDALPQKQAGQAQPTLAEPPPSQAPPRQCTASLKVVQLGRAQSCWIDERVSGKQGQLSYPCDGGEAQARFGEVVFVGRVQGGVADLTLKTQFNFNDGCKWESTQHIQGALASTKVDFDYSEAPLPGQSSCASACKAKGTVYVTTP